MHSKLSCRPTTCWVPRHTTSQPSSGYNCSRMAFSRLLRSIEVFATISLPIVEWVAGMTSLREDGPRAKALGPSASDQTSLASRVISVLFLKSREMGQLFFASCAALSKAALSAPGTLAVVAKRILVMVGPASVFSNVTAALVSIDSGGRLAVVSWALSAMVKQPA